MDRPAVPASSITIEPWDPHGDPDDLAGVGNLIVEADAHDAPPGEPALHPVEEAVMLQHLPEHEVLRAWVARASDGRIVGWAGLKWTDTPENRDQAWVLGCVHPDARRQRVGSRLLATAVPVARREGRTTLCWELDAAGEDFVAGIGGAMKLRSRQSALPVARIDRALLERWVAQAPERAAGYSLVGWEGAPPDDLIGEYARVTDVMNGQPFDDFEHEDEVTTPDMVLASARAFDRQGIDHHALCARHDATGQLVGLTDLYIGRLTPWRAWQGNTGVDPAHRNKGLGRWLKAAMGLRLLDEFTDVTRIDTWNAGSNDAMLAINIQMGFDVVRWWGDWQADLTTVEDALSALAPGNSS